MVDLIEDSDVGGFADFDNRYLGAPPAPGLSRAALDTLPVIDISPFVAGGAEAARRDVARQIRQACVDIGFFYIAGHGISTDEMAEFERRCRDFFTLPLSEKRKIECGLSPVGQGFMQAGGLGPDRAGDVKERFFIGRELLPGEPEHGRYTAGRAQYPGEDVVPGFAGFMREQIAKRTALARRLARALALSLDLDEDELDGHYAYPGILMALNYYPPVDPSNLKANQWSFSPHTDYGAFTILQQDSTGGLEVRNMAGEWIEVPPLPGTFVVNIGDLFAMSTNDLYASNLHRAMNTRGADRISAALFVTHHGRTVVDCLRTCHGPGNPPRYGPVVAEDYVSKLIAQSRRTGRPGIATRTADRFKKA